MSTEKNPWTSLPTERAAPQRRRTSVYLYLVLLILTVIVIQCASLKPWTRSGSLPNRCSPPLPDLLSNYSVDASHPLVVSASIALDAFFSARASEEDIDSISISIVTPFGPVFEQSYGVLKANETKQGVVDRHAIYRIASISKMFTVLETLILRERGLLNWYASSSAYAFQ